MNEIALAKEEGIYTDTLIMAAHFELQHASIILLLKKHSSLDTFHNVEVREERTKGRSIKVACLTESQTILLVLLMRNTKKTTQLKVKFIESLLEERKAIGKQFAKIAKTNRLITLKKDLK